MRLRTKLFLSIGILFILIAIISYLLPTIFLEKDSLHFKRQLDEDSDRRANELIKQNQLVLSSFVKEMKGSIDSLLYLIYSTNQMNQILPENLSEFHKEPWQMAGQLIYFNDQIGFIQESQNQAIQATIILDQTPVYPIHSKLLQPGFYFVQFADQTKFFGVQIGRERPLILFDPQEIFNTSDQWDKVYFPTDNGTSNADISEKEYQTLLREELVKCKKYVQDQLYKNKTDLSDWLNSLHPSDEILVPQIQSQELETPYGVLWQNWNLLQPNHNTLDEPQGFFGRSMLQLFFNDLALKDPFQPTSPKGLVYLSDNQEKGFGLLTKDIIFKEVVFNSLEFLKNNPPLNQSIPISPELALIHVGPHFFVGNTLQLNSSDHSDQFTIGMRLIPLIKNLALSANVGVLLVQNQKILTAISSKGQTYTDSQLKDFPLNKLDITERGSIKFDNQGFYYAKIQEDAVNKLSLYFLVAADQTLYNKINQIENKTKQSLAWQLLCVSIGCLAIALIVLAYLSHRVTRPISYLATASEEVAVGHYNNVKLPKTKGGKDEIAILANSFAHMVEGLRDREKIRGVLNKVVSKEIAEEILKGTVHLGGEDKVVTILFADIRGFTKLTENFLPRDVIGLLNSFMTKLSRIIDEEGGVIDKFVGDEIMAIYGAPINQSDSGYRAVKSAVRMQDFLKICNSEREAQGRPKIEIGIGIHTGSVIAGNMGAEFRMNYTVLGANVNLASRLCQMAKPNQILTTEETLNSQNVSNNFEYKDNPPIEVRGFSQPIKTFEIIKMKG